ncbi:MAG: DUF4249 domain-containing protein [Bacteroidota bacterium]
MKSLRTLIPILLAVLMVTSCKEALDYDIPTAKPQLVVNSLFGRDSTWRIEVSTTAITGAGNQIESLKDAQITLLENGFEIADLSVDSTFSNPWYQRTDGEEDDAESKFYYHYTAVTEAKAGKEYAIMVSYPGFETVTAVSTVPQAQRAIYRVDRNFEAISIGGTEYAAVPFELHDNDRTNYFALELVTISKTTGESEKIRFFSRENIFAQNFDYRGAVVENGIFYDSKNGVYFSNEDFKGEIKPLRIYVESKYLTGDYDVKLRILNLSSEYYQFATTFQRQIRNQGNPFAEPAQVYSNINNGLGIFAGYSVRQLDIR